MAERSEIFEVYAGSISGGGFPAQIQQIIYYTQEKQKAFSDKTSNISSWYLPNVCMGTSGGNIALYIAISGNFTEGGIKRVIKSLNAEMFSQTWWPDPMAFIPTWTLGIFEGAVYRPGYGAKNLLDAFNTSSSIQTYEMWNTAFNKNQKKTCLFCNKSSSESYISPYTYSTYQFKTLPLKYLDGDINKISATVIASASVPILFKPVTIDGEDYIDGGVSYPSPLTPLQEEIFKCIKGIDGNKTATYDYEKTLSNPAIPTPTLEQETALAAKRDPLTYLHITYFSPYDVDAYYDENTKSALGSGSVFSFITDSSAVKDRYTALNLLERVMEPNQQIKVLDSQTGLYELSNLLRDYSSTHYFCELYVKENNWVDLNKFTPQDIFDKMEEAKSQINFYFFYVE